MNNPIQTFNPMGMAGLDTTSPLAGQQLNTAVPHPLLTPLPGDVGPGAPPPQGPSPAAIQAKLAGQNANAMMQAVARGGFAAPEVSGGAGPGLQGLLSHMPDLWVLSSLLGRR